MELARRERASFRHKSLISASDVLASNSPADRMPTDRITERLGKKGKPSNLKTSRLEAETKGSASKRFQNSRVCLRYEWHSEGRAHCHWNYFPANVSINLPLSWLDCIQNASKRPRSKLYRSNPPKYSLNVSMSKMSTPEIASSGCSRFFNL